jgi:hypothetical protein
MVRRRRIDTRRLSSAWAKLKGLGPSGWWLLVQAQVAILAARSLVRNRPRGSLVEEIGDAQEPAPPTRHEDRERVEAIGLAIDRVARFGFGRPLCLVRSIALQRVLTKHGIPGSRIRVGVRMNGSTFEAHAWVEWNGSAVADAPDYVATFAPFSALDPGFPSPLSILRGQAR